MKNVKTAEDLVNIFTQKFEDMLKFNNSSAENSIFDSWEKIIGDEKLSRNSELSDISRNTAIIVVSHSGWSQHVLIRKRTILSNFRKFYPELDVQDISVIVKTEFAQQRHIKTKEKYELKEEELAHINKFEQKMSKSPPPPPDLQKALKGLKKAILHKKQEENKNDYNIVE